MPLLPAVSLMAANHPVKPAGLCGAGHARHAPVRMRTLCNAHGRETAGYLKIAAGTRPVLTVLSALRNAAASIGGSLRE